MEKTLLNLIPGACSPEVHLSQYDKGRAVPFKLAEGKSAYSVPDGSEIVVQATKPSGLGFVVPVTFDGDTATMTITETMSNEYGRFPAELSITNNGNRIGTANFVMNIERSPHPEGTIDGDAETILPELTLLVERIEAAADSVDEDTQTVTEAKAEVLQAKADTLQAKADALTARDDALQAKADAITAKESAEASAQAAAEASERAEQLIGSVSTKADAIVKTASGEIASFTDGGDDLPMKSLKVNIVPKQSGSGEPSPSNVRTISGYDSVVVEQSGKNLIDMDLPYTTASSGTSNHWAKEFTLPKAGSWIRCSGKCSDGTALTDVAIVWLNGNTQIWNIGSNKGFQVPSNINEVTRVRLFTTSAYAGKTVTEFQIEYVEGQSSTATDYEPYEGESKSISLGQTVYGGTLDVVSGVLTITKGFTTFNGSESWILADPTAEGFYTALNSLVKTADYIGKIICNRLPTASNHQALDHKGVTNSITAFGKTSYPNQNWIYAKANGITTVAEWKTWLASNPLQVCYELATPIEVTLTPTQVKTLLGTNNIWSDSGSVEVEYRADTTLAYNELLSLIASLS